MGKIKVRKDVVDYMIKKIEKSNPNHDSLGRFTYGKMLLAPDTGTSGKSGFSYNSDVQHDGEFVLTKNGSKDFGEITPEMAKKMKRQAGKIRLRIGVENEKDKKNNYGEKHIDRDLRNKNLKDIGFDNARDFVEFITGDISYIFPNGMGLIAVREKDSHFSGAWIQLTPSKDGDFYDVKTASPLRSNWYKNKTPIWINPKLGVLTKSLGDPLAHQFNKIIESIYGISSNSNSIVSQQNDLSSKNFAKSLTYSGHKLQGRTRLYGMDISIENKKGSYRSGVDKDGHKWKTLMHYDYGYIRGTEGVDSDQVDVYVGPDKDAQKVYVIHQNDPVTHKYDENKCMLCFASAADAKAAYMKQYDRPGFYGSMTTMTIDEFKSFIFSKKGKMIHKSFDIQITDITENNKQQKLEQFNKALNAIAKNQPFVIKHIPTDDSPKYENLTVRLMNFDRSKIEKAVHKVALSLDADISGASKGESFVYKAQEELVDKYFKEFTDRTRAVYNFVISYFDLPDIRIVSKAGELRHKGKILYNPETGLPIKESDWKKFVAELEKFLNRNYTGIGEKIVLSAESLGIILDRLSKTNSLEAIRKMSLADLKAKRYDVDWISDSIKNMKDKFGDVISRERQARIQIAEDSAAQRVTRVSDDMRNNIQQIIIDGIRDKKSKSVVAQNLFDKCASLNRDMQRIADSEVQMASNSAYCKEEVYNSKPNEKVYFKRFEMNDDNTCKECKKLNGTVVLWSDVPLPEEHIKDQYAKYAIWEGKNEGKCPIGIVHCWCRGTWVRYYPEID